MESQLLYSDRCVLRPVQYEDSVAMSIMANEYDIWKNLRDYFPHPYTHDHALTFIHHSHEKPFAQNYSIFFQQQFCGVIGIIPGEDVHKHIAEIGYWIGKPFWGVGIATEVLTFFSNWLLQNEFYIKLYAGVFEYNQTSMRVLSKAGFHQEAILTKNVLKEDKLWDEYRFCKFNNS